MKPKAAGLAGLAIVVQLVTGCSDQERFRWGRKRALYQQSHGCGGDFLGKIKAATCIGN
jgi:hypothetical protein